MFYLTMHSTHFILRLYGVEKKEKEKSKKEEQFIVMLFWANTPNNWHGNQLNIHQCWMVTDVQTLVMITTGCSLLCRWYEDQQE